MHKRPCFWKLFGSERVNGLLSFIGSLATKYVLLSNEQCRTKPFFIDLNYVPNKIENVNLRANEPRTLIKHISCKCKCKFDSKKCNSN